jgi:hypothetical protein
MVLDKWLTGEVTTVSVETVDKALGELEEEGKKIRQLVDSEEYWNAFTRLTACISFFNIVAQQQPSKRGGIIGRLLNWIEEIKSTLGRIVRGVRGNGYSIGMSALFGVSVSISFPA